jgi:hypothetical protein
MIFRAKRNRMTVGAVSDRVLFPGERRQSIFKEKRAVGDHAHS